MNSTVCLPVPLFCFSCKFFSLTETPENYTVVLDEEGFKGETPGTRCFIQPLHRSGRVIFPLSK